MEKQHVQHEAKRYASELQHIHNGHIKPVGSIAFASIYAQAAPPEVVKFRPYWVEFRRDGDGLWLTAGRAMQGKGDIAIARNIVKALGSFYRIVRHKGNGRYVPE
jgi:hypothetical protein